MRKISKAEVFDIEEVSEMLHERFSIKELTTKFEIGQIKGRKIDNQWYANKEDIEQYQADLIQQEVYFTKEYEVNLTNLILEGRILDIGGGGEGIIGQFGGKHVVAIDPSERELREAPGECLKIIMDAKNLKFLNETFDTITLFFTLMYIPKKDHNLVFKEIYRSLKISGRVLIWDLKIPEKFEPDKKIYAVKLKVDLGKKIISTGYGTRWKEEVDKNYYTQLGIDTGLKLVEKQDINDDVFYIEFLKE